MDIRFEFDPERLGVGEYIAMEEIAEEIRTPAQVRAARDLLACFMVDGQGEPIERADARKALNALTLAGLFECLQSFMEQRSQQVDEAVLPNENAVG
jgi:hypothetical protein